MREARWATSRPRSRRARGIAAGAVVVSLALGACGDRAENGGAEDDAKPVRGGTLVIDGPSDLGPLNVFATADVWTQEVNRNLLFVPLLRLTPELDYAPGVAESWEASDTGAVFHLRRDLAWQDGRPTTAEDVVYTLRTAMNPATAYPSAGDFQRWSSVEAQDSYTVVVRWSKHAEPLAGVPFTPIMPKHALDSIPPERLRQAAFNRAPIGNGPYRFVSGRQNDRWVFEANPDFPASLGGPPNIERIVWRPVAENAAQVTDLETGAAQLGLAPPPGRTRQLDSVPGIHAIVKPSRKYAMIAWNGRRAPLDDARVRRALTLAIDRQEILDALRGGYGDLAAGPIAPHHWAFDPDVKPLPFDTAQADRLLDEAGLRDRDGDGMRETAAGKRLEIGLELPAGNPFNRDIAEMIRSDLERVGVRLEVTQLEFGTLIGHITSPDRDFDAALLGWESDFRINLRDTFHSGALQGPFQAAGYSNPAVDSLIDATDTTMDRDEAGRMYSRLQRILRDDQPWAFLFYYPDLFVASDRLKGVDMDIRGAFATLQRWWLVPEAGGAESNRGVVSDSGADE